jgi:hypothetical protein
MGPGLRAPMVGRRLAHGDRRKAVGFAPAAPRRCGPASKMSGKPVMTERPPGFQERSKHPVVNRFRTRKLRDCGGGQDVAFSVLGPLDEYGQFLGGG